MKKLLEATACLAEQKVTPMYESWSLGSKRFREMAN
jgi:hypothetical protein